MRLSLRTALYVVSLLLCSSCAFTKLNPSESVGSTYLFGVNAVDSTDNKEPIGGLVDPYGAAGKGQRVEIGHKYAIVLNRVWLRYLDDIKANTLIFSEVYEGAATSPTNTKLLLHRDGMPQNAFTGQSDVYIWGPVDSLDVPVRIVVYVIELDPKDDKSLFDAVVSAGKQIAAKSLPEKVTQGIEVLGNLLVALKRDTIDFAYDITFSPVANSVGTDVVATEGKTQRALPLQDATYAIIKGESGYRSVRIPDYAISVLLPFNWFGVTAASASQKREIDVENDDVELFQYGRYDNETSLNWGIGVVGETLYSLVRLPFFLLYAPFRRFYTRDPGTPLEQVRWRMGELQTEPAYGAPAGDRVGVPYTDKSWMVLSVVHANQNLRDKLMGNQPRVIATDATSNGTRPGTNKEKEAEEKAGADAKPDAAAAPGSTADTPPATTTEPKKAIR